MKATNETTAPKWIAYYRVSTKRQGLGLEAQRARVEAAAEAGAVIVDEVEQKESRKDDTNRPGLKKAMALTRKHKGC